MRAITIFSALDIVSYIFQGFIILYFLKPLLYEQAHLLPFFWGAGGFFEELFIVVLCFTIGQANSSLSHLVLQQGLTSSTLLRPSNYFLSFVGSVSDGQSRQSFGQRVTSRAFGLVWKPFTPRETAEIKAWLERESYDLSKRDCDRQIFSRAFGHFNFMKVKPCNFEEIIFNFNFSRNMSTAIFICIGLFSFYNFYNFDANLIFILSVGVFVFAFVFVRFIYFLGVFSKNIIRLLILEQESEN